MRAPSLFHPTESAALILWFLCFSADTSFDSPSSFAVVTKNKKVALGNVTMITPYYESDDVINAREGNDDEKDDDTPAATDDDKPATDDTPTAAADDKPATDDDKAKDDTPA